LSSMHRENGNVGTVAPRKEWSHGTSHIIVEQCCLKTTTEFTMEETATHVALTDSMPTVHVGAMWRKHEH
jgi:hypothetical protein